MQELQKIETQSLDLVAMARASEIASADDYRKAVELRRDIKDFIKKAEEHHGPTIAAAYKTWKEAHAAAGRITRPLQNAYEELTGKISAFDIKIRTQQIREERERREAEERIAAEARAKAEAEREQQINKALDSNDLEKAERLESAPLEVKSVYVPAVEKTEHVEIEGLTRRTHYDIEILEADLVPREYCMPDEKLIRKIVEVKKGKISIPGVQITERIIPVDRNKRS